MRLPVLSLQISLRAAAILAASPRAPRACRVTRAAPPEALRTSMPLPPSGVAVRERGITRYTGIRSPCRAGCRRRSAAGTRIWRPACSKSSPGAFGLERCSLGEPQPGVSAEQDRGSNANGYGCAEPRPVPWLRRTAAASLCPAMSCGSRDCGERCRHARRR
jgi:hypothetical protein